MVAATLDAGAEKCGRLIALVAEAIAGLAPGETLAVMTYDPSSKSIWPPGAG